MKKMRNALIFSLIATYVLSFVPVPTSAASNAYKVKLTSNLNVRAKASTSAKKRGLLKKGAIVTVTNHNSKWVKTTYKKKTGYLLKQHTKKYVAPKPYKAQVTATKLTIRAKASTSAKAIGSYKKNKIVTVVPHNSKWVKITYKKKTGYLLKKYTKKYVAPKSYKAQVTATKLTIRAKASTSAKAIGSYKQNTIFTATPYNSKWVKVTYNKKTGYVAKQYTKVYKPPAVSTPTPTGTIKPTIGPVVPFEKRYIAELTGTNVNVRETASAEAKSLGTISKPYTIVATNYNSDWIKVYFERRIGYIAKEFTKQVSADDGVTAYQLMDVRYPSMVTATEINQYIDRYEKANGKPSVFHGAGQTFIDVGNQAGINPTILAAMAIHESAYGTSGLSHAKYNVFSVAAFDSSPYDSAYKFTTVKQAIQYQVDFLKKGYLNDLGAPGVDYRSMGQFLGKGRETTSNGTIVNGTGIGMNYYYASDKNWGKTIAKHANNIHPFNATEFNNTGLMSGPLFGTQIPNYEDNFSSMKITGVAKSAIPLYTSKDKSKAAVATIPAKGKFQLLSKANNHWMKITYNGKTYYFQVSLSSYKSYFTLDNLLRYSHSIPETTLRYAQQTTTKVPSGMLTVYR